MTDETTEQTHSTQKILARAPGLDDERNKLAAFVGTGRATGMVEWIVYMHEGQFYELNRPGYITVTIENGAKLHDF